MKKSIAVLCLCLFLMTVPLLSGFSQMPGGEGCHATVLIKRFDVSRFNNDPALADLTARILAQTLQEELGSAVTIMAEEDGTSGRQADFEISGSYEGSNPPPSTLRIVLLNRKQGGSQHHQGHAFSSPQEITGIVQKAGRQLAEDIFRHLNCNFGTSTGPAEGTCYLLSYSGTSRDTVHLFQDPIHGKAPGIHENENKRAQQHQGSVVFVVSSEVVDPMKYAHLATPELVGGANRTLQQLRQHIPGAAQLEQDLRKVSAPDDKPYQSVWGEGQYTGHLQGESTNFSMGDSMMGSSIRRKISPTSGQGESNLKGKLVHGTAYLELSASAEAEVNPQASQKVMMGGQQSSVPWEPILNQPGKKTALGFPSVPFKMPLRDGAVTTVNYTPNVALPGLVQGKLEHQLNIRLKKLPDSAAECKRAKAIPDPDKAMRAMLDMMGPNAGNAFGQMFQGAPGGMPGMQPGHNGGWQQQPQDYQPQASPDYHQNYQQGYRQPPAYPGQYYQQPSPGSYQNGAYQGNNYPQQPYSPPNETNEDENWYDDAFSPEGAIDTLRNLFGF